MVCLAVSRPHFFVAAGNGPRKALRRHRIRPKDVKVAIQYAQNVCFGYEDSSSCRVAWDRVEELSSALARQMERELLEKNQAELCEEDPSACREYDV